MKSIIFIVLGAMFFACSKTSIVKPCSSMPKIVKNNKQYNLLGCNGEEILDKTYDYIDRRGQYLHVRKGQYVGLLDLNGTLIHKAIYDEISTYRGSIRLNNKTAWLDKNATIISDFRFNHHLNLIRNSNGYRTASEKEWEGPKALMNPIGEIVTPFKYPNIDYLTGELFLVWKEEWEEPIYSPEPVMMHGYLVKGLLHQSGKEIVPISVDRGDITAFDWLGEEMVQVRNRDSAAIYNSKGKIFIPFGRYEHFVKENKLIPYIKVMKKKDGESVYGYLDVNGTEIIAPEYTELNYRHGYMFVCKKYKEEESCGVLDRNNKVLVPLKYNYVEFVNDGLFKVRTKKYKIGLYQNNQMIIPPEYRDIIGSLSNDGYCLVAKYIEGKCTGFNTLYNTKNKKEIALTLEKDITGIQGFGYKGTLLGIQKNKKWGFINHHAKLVIPYKYDSVSSKNYGNKIIVKLNEKYGLIDENDNIILPFKYDYLRFIVKDRIEATEGKKEMIIDLNGKILSKLDV